MKKPDQAVTEPRLRFDKVARRLVASVSDAVHELVPPGTIVVFTVTAPVRLPSKTARALRDRIRSVLASGPGRAKLEERLEGNLVRIWVLTKKNVGERVIGLVHNPGPNADDLLATALSESPH